MLGTLGVVNDKVFEIIEYFKPKYYWIENPKSSAMWKYIKSKWEFDDDERFISVDYCKYSDWGYKKPTIFLTNINVDLKMCKNDCENIIISDKQKLHKSRMGTSKTIIDNGKIIRVNSAELRKKYKHKKDVSRDFGSGNNRYERYRIPEKIIEIFFNKIH